MKSKVIGKKLALILSICLLGGSLQAGCGTADSQEGEQEVMKQEAGVDQEAEDKDAADGDTDLKENADDSEVELPAETGYVFIAGGVSIATDMDMAPIAEQLGEPDGYFEQPSCAAQGTARIYTYSGFEIQTYPDGDRDLIACIILKDDSVSTPEGIDLSMSRNDIMETYGTDCTETDTSLVYERMGTKLCFIMDGDDIASIEYNSPVLN